MAQTCVLIDYDLITWEIRRIIHPEDDSQIVHHKPELGWGRVIVDHRDFPVHPIHQKPDYNLAKCADAVQHMTGRRPPNVSK